MTAPSPSRPVGRPAVLPASHRLTVNLTADQIATAQRLGDGNASAGVRKALESASWPGWTDNRPQKTS